MTRAKKYIIITLIIITTIASIFGVYITKPQILNQTTNSIEPNTETNILLNLQKQISENNKIIENITTPTKTLPQPENEHFARILLALLNIKTSIYTETKINIQSHIETILTFSKSDPFITQTFQNIDIDEIQSIQYFKNNFNQIIKDITLHTPPQHGHISHFLHKYIYPHLTYISKNSLGEQQTLYNAQQYLNQNKMIKFHTELLKIQTTTPLFNEYLEELTNLIKILEASKLTEKYISKTILTEL